MASRLQDVILRGTAAARPAATAVAPGTLYYSTDTQATDRSNGTTWETYSDAGSATGDVVGPGSATDNAVARFDGTTGKLIQNTSALTIADTGAITFPDGVKQTFNPDGTNAGLNVGSQAGDPSSLANGDVWYNSSSNELKARINGASVALAASVGTPVVLLDRVGQTDIVNTTTETTLYSFSVPGGTLGTTRSLRLVIDGDQLNNSGSSDTVTLRVKYGSTTLYQDDGVYASNATRISWRFDFTFGNTTATNAQYVSAIFLTSTRGGATTGNGDWNGDGLQNMVLSGTSAEDSTTTLTFSITIQHTVANASTSWRRQFASLYLV